MASTDTWVAFASGVGGALVGAVASLSATALAGRQRRAERREDAAAVRREQARAEQDRLVGAATSALALAADVAGRKSPRGMYVSAEELRQLQVRAAVVENGLGTLALTHPDARVSRAAADLLIALPLSLGTLTDHSHQPGAASDSGVEEAVVQKAVQQARELFDAIRSTLAG